MASPPATAAVGSEHPARAADLLVRLDVTVPGTVAIGAGTAIFVAGWCVAPRGRIRVLSFVVDGAEQPVSAHGMPRLDVFRGLHPRLDAFALGEVESDPASPDDPRLASYRSGFWGLVRISPAAGDACRLALRAVLEDGDEVVAELATVRREGLDPPARVPAPAPSCGPLVAICMATYEPPIRLFERQIDSIRAQTHANWVCVISDDCSDPERVDAVRRVIGDDPRFVVSRSPRRLGFYRNFERALALAPAQAGYVTLSDQDDVWHADKLETLVDRLGDAQLVYSDARIITEDGRLVSDTYWSHRRNNHTDLLSLLVANAVTGAASLFRRELLDTALPFPPAQFAHFHDHWLGLTALALGDIAFVDQPLYDYVQHGDAVLGHATATRMIGIRQRLGTLRNDPRERVRVARTRYFVDVCRLMQFASVLDMRCGERMSAAKRHTLRRFLGTERSLRAMAALAPRGARELLGRPETLGAEWSLFQAFAWRRLLTATTRDRPVRGLRLDALPPATLAPRAGRHEGAPATRAIAEKIAPLALAPRDDAPRRINLLIPTIDLEHFFGGYIGKLNLAHRLAGQGFRVRLVTVDPVPALPAGWQETLESYSGLSGLFDRVEVAFGRESRGLEVSRDDRFIASTWWTAHIAREAVRELGGERFLYLIQEYEPFTFPMGTFAALAAESYTFPHDALFSTELLRDFFRRRRLGVFADGATAGDAASAAFQNAITPIDPPTPAELAGRRPRRLLFYARPEPHAARNMFELGLLALDRALQAGAFRGDWELYGIGTVDAGRRIELGHGAHLDLVPRTQQADYARVLREYDVGLALMYTPHPSLVPLEMAAAGMLTVTNSFENKTHEAMAAISPNLITMEPSVESVAAGLEEAAAGVEDVDRRVRGSAVRWSSDWDESFDDELLERVAALLHA